MAKNNGATVTTPETTTTPAPASVSKEDMRKLFTAYDDAVAAVVKLDTKREALVNARSAAVKAIVEASGGRKGPFRHPTSGALVSAVERVSKEEGKPSNWYFKGPATTEIIEV